MICNIIDNGDGSIDVTIEDLSYTTDVDLDFITADDEEEIRWYIEEFANFPYGSHKRRAHLTEQRLLQIGQKLFFSVCPENMLQNFEQKLSKDIKQLQIKLFSDSFSFLSVPWELLSYDATNFIIPNSLSLNRYISNTLSPHLPTRSKSNLRILLVISRPDFDSISNTNIAQPILDALDGTDQMTKIELELLRPATFDEFKRKVNVFPFYDIIHFDGHGVVSSSGKSNSQELEGYLLFEDANRKSIYISATELLNNLPDYNTAFVLNSCYSAFENSLHSNISISSRLSIAGANFVIGMPYAVSSKTARNFFSLFYKYLFQGNDVVIAFTKTQQQLLEDRKSSISLIHDWIVPRLFLNSHSATTAPVALKGMIDEKINKNRNAIFFRDNELLKLDGLISVYSNEIAYLSGIIGEGKTFFAKNFALWYSKTGGCKNVVYVDLSKEVLAIVNTAPHDTLFIFDHAEGLVNTFIAQVDVILESLHKIKGKIIIVARNAFKLSSHINGIDLGDLPDPAITGVLSEVLVRLRPQFENNFLFEDFILAIDYHGATLDRMLKLSETSDIIDLLEQANFGHAHEPPLFDIEKIDEIYSTLPGAARRYLPVLSLFGKRLNPNSISIITNGGLVDNTFGEIYQKRLTTEDWERLIYKLADAGLARNSGPLFEIPLIVHYYLRRRLYASLKAISLS